MSVTVTLTNHQAYLLQVAMATHAKHTAKANKSLARKGDYSSFIASRQHEVTKLSVVSALISEALVADLAPREFDDVERRNNGGLTIREQFAIDPDYFPN